jgi:ribose/xylose/arabinose/galactoside ABC-type transport system permease subunit
MKHQEASPMLVAETSPSLKQPSRRHRWLVLGVSVAAILVLFVLGGIAQPEFATVYNLLTVVRAASVTGIVALGLTFVTISGNYFSLSVAQTAVLSSVVYAMVASTTGFFVGFLVTMAVCFMVGAIQGAIIGFGGNPVVVTLAAGAAILGVVLVITNSARVRLAAPVDSLAVLIGRSAPLGVPMATWAFVVLSVVCYLVLQRTTLGRRTMLVGANKRTAVAVGINVRGVIIAAFCISAVMAALAGVLTTAEFGVADTAQFPDLDINAVAAVLVGGTAIKGGQGSIVQTCVGVLFISLLRNFLQILGLSTGVQLLFVGAAVVLAVSAYAILKGARR